MTPRFWPEMMFAQGRRGAADNVIATEFRNDNPNLAACSYGRRASGISANQIALHTRIGRRYALKSRTYENTTAVAGNQVSRRCCRAANENIVGHNTYANSITGASGSARRVGANKTAFNNATCSHSTIGKITDDDAAIGRAIDDQAAHNAIVSSHGKTGDDVSKINFNTQHSVGALRRAVGIGRTARLRIAINRDGIGDGRQRRDRRNGANARAGNIERDGLRAQRAVGAIDGFAQRTGARIIGINDYRRAAASFRPVPAALKPRVRRKLPRETAIENLDFSWRHLRLSFCLRRLTAHFETIGAAYENLGVVAAKLSNADLRAPTARLFIARCNADDAG